MTEFWQQTYSRGQQTVGVWSTFAPTFTVGSLTLAAHQADVTAIPARVSDRDVQQDVVEFAMAARDANTRLIRDINVRLPQVMEASLDDDDPLHEQLDDVFAIDPESEQGNLERARRLMALWARVDAQRTAQAPPLPALTLNNSTLADLDSAVTRHEVLLQTLENERAELSQKKSALRAAERKADRGNKRWYRAWSSTFVPGTPERDALSQIDIDSGANAPETVEIAALTREGQNVRVSYVPGGGEGGTTLQLLHQVVGTDADWGHATNLDPNGQTIGPFAAGATVNVQTRAYNAAGTTSGAMQSITLT